MKPRFSLLAAAALSFAFCAPASATTTLYKFCSDSADGSEYADNRAAATAAGWTIYDVGADSTSNDGTYSHPVRLKNSTTLTSPTYTDGWAIKKVVVGARATNTERVVNVKDSKNETHVQALTETGKRQGLEFVFDTQDGIVSVVISTPTGTGNSYLYDVSITTLKPLSSPSSLALDGDAGANGFVVEWGNVANAEGYSVKLLDANDTVVSSNDVSSATTTASFTGLTSSSEYTVVVVALGDYNTTDDSAAKTLVVETAASAAAAPMLVVANTSWTAGVAGSSSVTATLEGNIACTITSVSMSDGSTATVANGTFSWTPPAANLASSVTATFHVTHDMDGWDLTQVLSVAATPAPSAPAISFDNVSRRSFDASWTASAGGPVVSYKIRAWTGRATPDDSTGGESEDFSDYLATTNVPSGWIFMTTKKPYNQEDNPVDFRNNNEWVATPDYGGTITSISFRLRRQSESGSTFKVYGSTGSDDPDVWKTEENTLATLNPLATQVYNISVDSSKGISRVFFQYTKVGGNVSIGSFSVSGTDWPAADFLEGWGGAKVSVGSATSQTFSNPVAGTANYVEVTAIGPSGLATSAIRSVDIPHAPGGVISVK